MSDLPTLYQRVCEKRAEARVGIQWLQPSDVFPVGEWIYIDTCEDLDDYEAEALILRHWLGLLPELVSLTHDFDGWVVKDYALSDGPRYVGESPTLALAAYLLEAP